jgi:hypothetical protein
MTNEARVLSALRRGMRVTRKTAIERGWCENLTATISREGSYTRYKLLSGPSVQSKAA